MIAPGGDLLVATRNRGKTKEFSEAFAKLGVTVRDLNETEGLPEVEETGTTFADNAYLKAKAIGDAVGMAVLADDSGLCVDALRGEPGVYSARYAGVGAKDADNNAKLLRELEAAGAEEPSEEPALLSPARFECALVLYDPADGSRIDSAGAVEGFILREPRGKDGFGYDPLFWVPSFGKSMAELTPGEKNAISHRGLALAGLLAKLK